MKKKLLFVVALAILAILLVVAPVSADGIVTREEVQIDNTFRADCADSDIGDIHMEGTYIITTTTVLDGNGRVHFSSHFNWEAFTGTGLTSGDTYVVTQVLSHTQHGLVEEGDL